MKSEDFFIDLISQTEMEICSQSGIFLWSAQSTWSGEVNYRRKHVLKQDTTMDQNVLFLVEQLLQKRKDF